MTDEGTKLLKEARDALNVVAYQPGEYESLRHIDYCRWCHYARSHPHGDECIITRIDAYLATGGWIPVSERLPELGSAHYSKAVLIYTPVNLCVFCCNFDGTGWTIFGTNQRIVHEVTHWQPLPALPKKEG